MKELVIVGQPLGHSLSPVMHNAALSAMGLETEYSYRPLPLRFDELPSLVDDIKKQTITGANITIPYKTKIMTFLPMVNKESEVLGAVNTLYYSEDTVIGCNTDVLGFREALREYGVHVHGLSASILGAGGAARAVAYALAEDGVEALDIFCRTKQRAEELASMLRSRFTIQVNLHCNPTAIYPHLATDLLVNCTPVGMQGHSIAETPMKSSHLNESMIVMDLVYNPLKTLLLTEAQRAGCKTIGGVEMLVYQGAASFELWTGIRPPVSVMKQTVLDALGGSTNE